MDRRELGSHAWDVYPTQDTSHIRTARVTQEKKQTPEWTAWIVVRNLEERNVGNGSTPECHIKKLIF